MVGADASEPPICSAELCAVPNRYAWLRAGGVAWRRMVFFPRERFEPKIFISVPVRIFLFSKTVIIRKK